MVSATVDSAATTFAYRGDGLRESRTSNSNTVTFTWDIAAGLSVVIDDEDARYVYGAGLASQVTSSESYYYLSDGLGSTMVTVDSDGDVVNSYTYDVFGQTRSESGAQANEFQFAGQQVDGSASTTVGGISLRIGRAARRINKPVRAWIDRNVVYFEPSLLAEPRA